MTAYAVLAAEAVHGTRRFRPQGRLVEYDSPAQPNPATRLGSGGYAARLFVGLKVGNEERWKTADIIRIVRDVRKAQGKSADASILAQSGIYEDRSGELVVEPSVQVIIIDLVGEKKNTFVGSMKELGERLVKDLEQEAVILEIQRRGIVSDVYTITPS